MKYKFEFETGQPVIANDIISDEEAIMRYLSYCLPASTDRYVSRIIKRLVRVVDGVETEVEIK